MKQIDNTAGRIGVAMRDARRNAHMPMDVVAWLLHVSLADLQQFETGTKQIPMEVIRYICLMGYQLLQIRSFERMYKQRQYFFNKMRQMKADIGDLQ